MMVDKHSSINLSTPFEKLHSHCASIARSLSPSQADEWLDSAQHLIQNTADAIRSLSTFCAHGSVPTDCSVSRSTRSDPAFQFAVKTADSSVPCQATPTVMAAAHAVRNGDI